MALDEKLSGQASAAKAAAASQEAKPEGGATRPGAPLGRAGTPPEKPAATRIGRSPAWVVPLYLLGLVLIYMGERVLVEFDQGQLLIRGLGLGCVIAATAARFYAPWRTGGDRASIEKLLSILSVCGLLGVLAYFVSTDPWLARLGFDEASGESQDRAQTVLTIVWISLIAASVVPMLFAEAALYPMRDAERLEARRVQAAAGTGFVLVLAALYGSLFVYSAGKAEVQVDYSYFKTSEPGSSTKRLLEDLTEPLKVTAFFPDISDVRPQVQQYLNKLVAGVPNIEMRMADRYLEPELAKKARVNQDGVILFERGDQQQQLTVPTELTLARKKLRNLDQEVNESLLKLLRVRRTIYVTVGHGEIFETPTEKAPSEAQELRTGKLLKQLMEQLNYRVRNLGIAEGLGNEVPKDATIVAVVGPTEPFTPEETDALRRYVAQGGKLLLALDADSFSTRIKAELEEEANAAAQQAGPKTAQGAAGGAAVSDAPEASPTVLADSALIESLKELADLVGLDFEPTVLANESRHMRRRNNDSDRILIPSQRYSSHASVSTVGRRRNAILFAGSGYITVEADPPGNRKVDFAVRALPGTFADKNGNFKEDTGEKESNYSLVAAVTDEDAKPPATDKEESERRDKRTDPTPPEMRAFVIADADILTDLVMSRVQENQLFIYDALRWLGGEESLAGTINTEEDVRIEHTKQKDQLWFYSTIIGLPFVVLGLGLIYSRSSRTKKGRKA